MTAQAPDSLSWHGRKMALHVLPLNLLFSQLVPLLGSAVFSSANTRGYLAAWEIRDEKLFLVGIQTSLGPNVGDPSWSPRKFEARSEAYDGLISEITLLSSDAAGMKISNAEWHGSKIPEENGCICESLSRNIDITELLSGRLLPLAATWYTGLLRSSHGEVLEYVHGGFGTLHEYDLVIHIVGGRVVQSWTIDNRPGFELREHRKKEEDTLFSAVLNSAMMYPLGEQSPAIARATYSRRHGNKLNEVIHHAILQHYADKYEPSFAGSERDFTLRVEYDAAVRTYDESSFVAGLLLGLKDMGKDFLELDLGEFISIITMHIDLLKNANEIMCTIKLPEGGYDRWAEMHLRKMDELVAQEKFNLLGFCHGILTELQVEDVK